MENKLLLVYFWLNYQREKKEKSKILNVVISVSLSYSSLENRWGMEGHGLVGMVGMDWLLDYAILVLLNSII